MTVTAAARHPQTRTEPKSQKADLTGAAVEKAMAKHPENVNLVKEKADKLKVDRDLALAVAFHESKFDSNAGSPSGVKGVMQLTKRTGKENGFDRDNNDQNVEGGMTVLKKAVTRCGTEDYACLAKNYNGASAAEQAKWAKGVKDARSYISGTRY